MAEIDGFCNYAAEAACRELSVGQEVVLLGESQLAGRIVEKLVDRVDVEIEGGATRRCYANSVRPLGGAQAVAAIEPEPEAVGGQFVLL